MSSLVAEEDWIEALSPALVWNPPHIPTVVIVPHPDDETLGAGGLILAQRRLGIPVSVVSVTDGEAAYSDASGLGEIRRLEQESALEKLGVMRPAITRLRLPDSDVSAHEPELASCLTALIKPGSLVVAPWPRDWHPDHEACGRVAQRIAVNAGAELVFYLFWTWHQKTIDSLATEKLLRFQLTQEILRKKQDALACHRSQLQRDVGAPILPEGLLKPAKRSFEIFVSHE